MFSEAISSISWRCRPSSPLIAAAISGSASARVAVKKESGAEPELERAVALLEEAVIGEYLPRGKPLGCGRSIVGGRSWSKAITTSPHAGQAVAVGTRELCQIW